MAFSAKSSEISVLEVARSRMTFCILGTTPLIHNRMPEKAKHELLLPNARKNAAEKASTLKHNPLQEFRSSPNITRNPNAKAMFYINPTAFKGAMMTAAMDMPGVAKTQIKRLIYIEGSEIEVFGIPELLMAVIRNSDVKRSPDIRSRAIMREWACQITVQYPTQLIKDKSIINLLSAGGIFCGIGDWRQEKGSGNYGCFKIVSQDDPDFARIINTMGKEAQAKAFENPLFFDQDTEDLLSWYEVETNRRGIKVAA